MCTKLPNWGNEYHLEIGESGFITTQNLIAGEIYFNRLSGKNETAKFTNVYFKEFIKDNKNIEKIIL